MKMIFDMNVKFIWMLLIKSFTCDIVLAHLIGQKVDQTGTP